MIEIKNLQVKYDKTFHNPEVIAINNLSICLERGQFHVIIGQSGSGKTSLLRAIAGLTNHTGSIFVDGVDFDNIHPSDRNIAYVSQNYALYPHMTVFDNIAFPLKTRGASKKEIVDTVYEASKMLDIDYFKKINDTYGHEAGDRVLHLMGDTLTANGKGDLCCRLGGDEFLFFMKKRTQKA